MSRVLILREKGIKIKEGGRGGIGRRARFRT